MVCLCCADSIASYSISSTDMYTCAHVHTLCWCHTLYTCGCVNMYRKRIAVLFLGTITCYRVISHHNHSMVHGAIAVRFISFYLLSFQPSFLPSFSSWDIQLMECCMIGVNIRMWNMCLRYYFDFCNFVYTVLFQLHVTIILFDSPWNIHVSYFLTICSLTFNLATDRLCWFLHPPESWQCR